MNKKVVKSSVLTLALMMVMVFAMSLTVYAASAPVGLTQTDASTGSVTVKWNAVVEEGVYGYNVYYSADGVNWVRTGAGNSDTTKPEETIYSLSAGMTYYVAVSTVVRTGTSYSNYQYIEGSMSAPIDVVTAPDTTNYEVVQSDASTSNVTLTATGAVGANYYEAYINDQCVAASMAPTFAMQVPLTQATQYSIQVYAARINSAGTFAAASAYGYERVTAKTLAKKLSTDEFGLRNAWDSLNSYQFGVTLSEGCTVDGVQFQFKDAKGKKKKTATKDGTYVELNKFINGKFYQYRVRTYVYTSNGKKYSAWSGYRYIGVPGKTKCVTTGRKIKLSWSKVSGATGYTVYISTKEHSGYKKVKTLGKGAGSITITKCKGKSLKKGKTYYVKLVPHAKISKKNRQTQFWYYWKCEI